MDSTKGRLIVFEGVEGCGKTTQMNRIISWIASSGIEVTLQLFKRISQLVSTREPGGTHIGQEIRKILLTPGVESLEERSELLLYAADRAQHVELVLKPLLEQKTLILCDRFTDSAIAYQGYGRGLDLDLIDKLNDIATDGLKSDLTLWLDLDVEDGLSRAKSRGEHDRIEQAAIDFHRRVQQGFSELAKANPDRIVRIDASGDKDEVTERIKTVLIRKLRNWVHTDLKEFA